MQHNNSWSITSYIRSFLPQPTEFLKFNDLISDLQKIITQSALIQQKSPVNMRLVSKDFKKWTDEILLQHPTSHHFFRVKLAFIQKNEQDLSFLIQKMNSLLELSNKDEFVEMIHQMFLQKGSYGQPSDPLIEPLLQSRYLDPSRDISLCKAWLEHHQPTSPLLSFSNIETAKVKEWFRSAISPFNKTTSLIQYLLDNNHLKEFSLKDVDSTCYYSFINYESFSLVLESGQVDVPKEHMHTVIIQAFKSNCTDDAMNSLLKYGNAQQFVFQKACFDGDINKVVELLLDQDDSLQISEYDYLALEVAIRRGHASIVKLLLKNEQIIQLMKEVNENSSSFFRSIIKGIETAIRNGHEQIFECFLDCKDTQFQNCLVEIASRFGYLEVVKLLLNKNNSVNALHRAVLSNHTIVVTYILEHSECNPENIYKNIIQSISCKNNATLNILLGKLKLLDSSLYAFVNACLTGDVNQVQLLIKQIDCSIFLKSFHDVDVLSRGHPEVLDVFLHHDKLQPIVNEYMKNMKNVLSDSNAHLIKKVLKDKTTNLSDDDANLLYKIALAESYEEILEIILQDSRFKISDDHLLQFFLWAREHQHYNILKLLKNKFWRINWNFSFWKAKIDITLKNY